MQQRSGPVDGTDAGGGIKISDPTDQFEREAVANADRVMSAPAPTLRLQRLAGLRPIPTGMLLLVSLGASVRTG